MQFDAYLRPFTQSARIHKGQLLKGALAGLALDRKDQQVLAQEAAGPGLSDAANQLAFASLIVQFKERHRNQRVAGAHTTYLGHRIACRKSRILRENGTATSEIAGTAIAEPSAL